jgi:hypothetical protein
MEWPGNTITSRSQHTRFFPMTMNETRKKQIKSSRSARAMAHVSVLGGRTRNNQVKPETYS